MLNRSPAQHLHGQKQRGVSTLTILICNYTWAIDLEMQHPLPHSLVTAQKEEGGRPRRELNVLSLPIRLDDECIGYCQRDTTYLTTTYISQTSKGISVGLREKLPEQ